MRGVNRIGVLNTLGAFTCAACNPLSCASTPNLRSCNHCCYMRKLSLRFPSFFRCPELPAASSNLALGYIGSFRSLHSICFAVAELSLIVLCYRLHVLGPLILLPCIVMDSFKMGPP